MFPVTYFIIRYDIYLYKIFYILTVPCRFGAVLCICQLQGPLKLSYMLSPLADSALCLFLYVTFCLFLHFQIIVFLLFFPAEMIAKSVHIILWDKEIDCCEF